MRKLTDEENLKFMNDPRRIKAQKELDNARHAISVNTKFNGTAQYYLTMLPPMLKKLESAYENLNIVEAMIEEEILSQK